MSRGCPRLRSPATGATARERVTIHMQRFSKKGAVLGISVLFVLLGLGVGGAQAALGQHGIAFVKGCDSPTNIGDPYNCSYTILNVVDTVHDTLSVTGLSDQVHAASGDVNSGNILPALQLVFSGAVNCVGGSGA